MNVQHINTNAHSCATTQMEATCAPAFPATICLQTEWDATVKWLINKTIAHNDPQTHLSCDYF